MAERTIIHLDLDAFYCAVEEIFHPELRGKPFAVGGRPDSRGVVSSCSYAARANGVHSALPMSRAVLLCPELIILPGQHKEYAKKSRQVMSVLRQYTSQIEQISIDEAFLDVSEHTGNIHTLTKLIQTEIYKTCNLPCSLGVASNKLVAKIATDVGKGSVSTNTYPNAILIVPFGNEAEFLAPLPVESLWGVGPKTAENLEQLGIKNIGELAIWPLRDMVKRFGKTGHDLHNRANGIDLRPIETYREPKSFSQEITFVHDISNKEQIFNQIKKQCQRIAKSLSEANLLCTTVKLKIRWPNFSTISRQITLQKPTDDQDEIFRNALDLLLSNWDQHEAIRLIGVGVSGLNPPSTQLNLWDRYDYTKLAKIEAVIYQLNSKFGEKSIQKGIETQQSAHRNEEKNE